MKTSHSLILASVLLSILDFTIPSPLGSTVTINSGQILGNPRDANGVLSFKGIPYAAPPIGNLRWQSPKAPVSSPSTLNTTVFGSSCYASSTSLEPYFTPPNEDCLFLNVWTSATLSTAKLPVMVFIPGGGFQFGSAAQPTYGGSNLAKEGIIVVTINYRLGVFGFLALTELDAQGTSSGNYGLQDQIAALRWVQENIASFGGDPKQVTLFGQSAGAHSIGMLMTSPLTTGLFSKAILESGALWDSAAGPLATYHYARQKGAEFKSKVGATSVAQLRAMTAATISGATQWMSTTDPKVTSFSPTLDFYVLLLQPGLAFATGLYHKVPLIGGFNANEGLIFASYGLSQTNTTKYQDGLQAYFNPRASQALALYPDSNPVLLQNSAINLIGDLVIREQIYSVLNYQRLTSDVAVFAYNFTYTSPYSPVALHTAELPFVFGNLVPRPIFGPNEGLPTSQDAAFSQSVVSYWTNFAKTGNPNGADLPTWPAYARNGVGVLQLGDILTATNYDPTRPQFIASFRTSGVLPAHWININVSTIN